MGIFDVLHINNMGERAMLKKRLIGGLVVAIFVFSLVAVAVFAWSLARPEVFVKVNVKGSPAKVENGKNYSEGSW